MVSLRSLEVDQNKSLSWNQLTRNCRGWLYRRLPLWNGKCYRKKLTGYERRWGLEQGGLTKEGFFRILQNNIIATVQVGDFYELVVGDGLVGSLGAWLERERGEWRVKAWEHRPHPLAALCKNRPGTEIHGDRMTNWTEKETDASLAGVTSRGVRESAAICREIRKGRIRPNLVGIWNPTRRPVWIHRLARAGYQLEIVYDRMEFYRDSRK